MKQFLILATAFLLGTLAVQAQNSRFNQLSVQQGLASPQVKKIYQDKTGFIWFCTSNGLQRFDGKNFKTFYSNSKDSNCIAGDDINDIREDKFGRFWIATVEKGLSIYDPAKNTFLNFNEKNDTLFNQDGDNLIKIAFTKDGESAIITGYNGLYVFNVKTLKRRRFRTDNSKIPDNRLTDQANIRDQLFLISTAKGITLFDAARSVFYDESDAPVFRKVLSFSKGITASVMAMDIKGNYWFSLWNTSFYCYRPSNDTLCQISVGEKPDPKSRFKNMVNGITPDEYGNYYLSTHGAGIFYLDIQNESITHRFVNDPNDPHSLISPNALSVFIDREKNIWVCTAEGVSYLTNKNKSVFEALADKKIRYVPSAVLESSNGHIWAGTYSGYGLYELDAQFNIIANYPKFHGRMDFDENAIWRLAESRNGHILICRQNGFSTIHATTHKQDDYTDVPLLNGTAITSVQEDDRSRWWMGTWGKHLLCFDPATRKAKAFTTPGISYVVAKDKSKLLLNIYDRHYRFYTFDTEDSSLHREPYHFFNPKFPNLTHDVNDINAITFDHHLAYIVTQRGLYVVNNSNGSTQYFTRSEGLPSTTLLSIIKDSRDRVWIGTRQGISLFNQAAGTFRNFNEDDRLSNQEFQLLALTQLRNGTIIAGNLFSLVAFNPDSLLSYKPLVPPVITALRIGGNETPAVEDSITHKVSYRASNIVVDFASLDFAHASSIVYAYMLQGFDKDWQYAAHGTSATYTNLDGGKYSFLVKASANGTDWVEAKNKLFFSVSSPFYKRAWFIVLLIVFVIALLYVFYRIRIERILEMQRLRNDISKDLHDDVGATMTSISILSEVASQKIKTQDIREADEMMEQIGNSSRTLLQNLDDIIWSIDPHNDPIEKVVLRMKELTAEMLEPNRIQYHLAFDQKLENIAIPMKDRRHLFLIYKEALHNMVKYAHCRNATLSMFTTDHSLVLKVEDDGKGFNPDVVYPGNGLTNMRQRAEDMNATLSIQSQPGKGASVMLRYPLN